LGYDGQAAIAEDLREQNERGLEEFVRDLERSLSRQVDSVYILFLHGPSLKAGTVGEAISLIEEYAEQELVEGFVRYEVIVRYSNGDEVTGKFESKTEAVKFLNSMG
jgi:hypothetical protein